jgi:hypothetical protein
MGQFLRSGVSARPWNVAADHFEREIMPFDTLSWGALTAAERHLLGEQPSMVAAVYLFDGTSTS